MDSLRTVELIPVASGLGAPAGTRAACAAGPAALRAAGVDAGLRREGLACRWQPELKPDSNGTGENEALPPLCDALAQRVSATLAAGALPLVIGGDHSIAWGTWRGVGQALQGGFGLIWIDAHLDAHTPATSPSGNRHGMPLAALLGDPVAGLSVSAAQAPILDPTRLCVLGARSFEPAELQHLLALGVRIIGADEIGARGLAASLRLALEHARRSGRPGGGRFGLSIDLDALDPGAAPGVNTPVPGGLNPAALATALDGLARDPDCVALEIVEYNPQRDSDGRTAARVAELLAALAAPDADTLMTWEAAYGAHNYAPLPVVLSRAEGCRAWDRDGRDYLDLMSAYSAVSLGHAHPRLLAALARQAQRLAVTSRAYHNDRLPLLLRRLSEVFGYEAVLPVNTGLEAVETALKAARKWAYTVKGVAPDRARIVACEGNFHGRSIAIIGLSSEAQYREGFGPFPPGLVSVPYGDAAALDAAITPDTAAFLVEPVQGEGGIVLPHAGYLAACAEICRRHDVLLICDEVQTGLGRTGKLLASWHEGVRPDGVILGKALGGGLLPVSAFLADRRVMDVFQPGDHGSTFGGNALAAAVALEALDILVEEKLADRSAELGAYFLERLRSIASPLIREVRGRGLFIGIEVTPRLTDARSVCLKLLDHGLLSKDTHATVVRIAPPLTITREEIDLAMTRIAAALRELEAALPARKRA